MTRICPHCGNEKLRYETRGSYRFRCDCLVWREYMKVLERARRREGPRPPTPMMEVTETVPVAPPAPEPIPVTVGP